MFQNSETQLFCKSVREEIAFGLLQLGLSGEEVQRRTEQYMDMLDIGALEERAPFHLSGGEKKKAEILQLLMLKPSLAILDETDSGLDVDAVKTVSDGIDEYKKTVGGALLIITHSTRILESLHVDRTHVVVEGRVVAEGDGSLVDEINENGFEKYLQK